MVGWGRRARRARGRRCGGALTLVAVFVLLLAACTGDDEDGEERTDGADGADPGTEETASDEDASDEAFAEAYQAAAEDYADALEVVQNERAPAVAEDPVGAHEVYDELRAVTEAAREDFATLDAPSELDDELDGLLANFSAQIDTLADAVEAASERDDRALQRSLEDYADQLSVWRERHAELTDRLADA